MTARTRQDAIAKLLCHTWLVAAIPAYFHHLAPLVIWMAAWCVLIAAREQNT